MKQLLRPAFFLLLLTSFSTSFANSVVFSTTKPNAAFTTFVFNAIPVRTYGALDFVPNATSSLTITFSSSDLTVATIVSGKVHVVGVGTSTITATISDVNGPVSKTQVLTVNPATVTVTAASKSKTYGAALPAFTVTYAGFKNGDTPNSLTTHPVATTLATAASAAGTYAITAAGAVLANYTFAYVSGTLTVTQVPLSVQADNAGKIYGAANPVLTASYTGLVNGDTQASFATPPTITTTAVTGSVVGVYPVSISGIVAPNYLITYTNGTLSVNKATLTITAVNKVKAFGAALPAFTVTYGGFVNGDQVSALTTLPIATTPATASSPAGNYLITPGGAAAANYTFNYVAGTLTINQPIANISYTSPQKYTAGVTISLLTPVNTGGTVPFGLYGQTVTFAGSGAAGSTNGSGTAASFNNPYGMAVDANGNIYIAETGSNLIRKITPTGMVTTLAGSGAPGWANGTGTAASFNMPFGLCVDASGNVYVADNVNNVIRKITPGGVVTTFAGSGAAGADNGVAGVASFKNLSGIAIDAAGNLYIADGGNNLIRKISLAGVVSTLAGSGAAGSANGTGTAASFNFPSGVAVDANGLIYVADAGNNLIRKITPAGVVTTFAGSGMPGLADGTGAAASFNKPSGLCADVAGNVYVVDYINNIIRKITPVGVVSTLAGSGTAGAHDGIGTDASFYVLTGIAVDAAGYVYVADADNNLIRRITSRGFATNPALPAGLTIDGNGVISGTPSAGIAATNFIINAINSAGIAKATLNIAVALPLPPAITYAGPQAYIENMAISPLLPSNTGGTVPPANMGRVTTVAGNLSAGFVNGPAAQSSFSFPYGITSDANGNLYVADANNYAIRKITPSGIVTTLAGSGFPGSFNGTGVNAGFSNPTNVAADASGNIYVSDGFEIRMITPAGVVSTLAGSGTPGAANGTGIAASFNNEHGLAVDKNHNVYVADSGNALIRMITPAGVVSTLAGSGVQGFANGTGTAASFSEPQDLTIDKTGNVYVADVGNGLIRKITPAGVVTTFAGNGTAASVDGLGGAASFNAPNAITIDNAGTIFVTETNVFRQIRAISPTGLVTTVHMVGGNPPRFSPFGITADPSGNIYLTDISNNLVREMFVQGYFISPSLPFGLGFNASNGAITGIPTGLSGDTKYTITAGNPGGIVSTTVDIAVNNFINSSTIPNIFTVAGNGARATTGDGGPGAQASFNHPYAMARDNAGNIYLATFDNYIRKIAAGTNIVTTIAGTGVAGYSGDNGPATSAQLNLGLAALAVDANNNIYIGDGNNNAIRKINAGTKVITTIAGKGPASAGYSGDGGLATAALLNAPEGMAFDAKGNLYFSDVNNAVIRKIDATTHKISTVIGGGPTVSLTSPVAPSAIQLSYVERITFDKDFNLYMPDEGNYVVWKLDAAANTITSIAGNGQQGFAGDGGLATNAALGGVMGVAIDATGNVFLADQPNNVIRKIDVSTKNISVYAGIGSGVYSGDGGSASLAGINFITDLLFDNTGVMYVDDYVNNVVRKIGGMPAPQTITFTALPAEVYGNADFSITATASSGLPVSISSSNPAVATITGNLVHITGAGQSTFTASQAGDINNAAATNVTRVLTVTQAPLTITADDKTKVAGDVNPPLTASYSGFVNNETSAVLTKQPNILTAAKTTSVAGSYPITAGGATAANYKFTYVAGTLTVTNPGGRNISTNNLRALNQGTEVPAVNGPGIHQGLSPNGDGINDVLVIDNIKNYPDNKLVVVNANGLKVFEASGYDNINKAFKGRSNITGALQRPGTYFYVLEYRDKGVAKRKTGYILIKF